MIFSWYQALTIWFSCHNFHTTPVVLPNAWSVFKRINCHKHDSLLHFESLTWNYVPLSINEALRVRPVTRGFDVLICAWINDWVNNREAGGLMKTVSFITVAWLAMGQSYITLNCMGKSKSDQYRSKANHNRAKCAHLLLEINCLLYMHPKICVDSFTQWRQGIITDCVNFFCYWLVIFLYPFPNSKCATVTVYEWMSNSIPHFTGNMITYLCWDWT